MGRKIILQIPRRKAQIQSGERNDSIKKNLKKIPAKTGLRSRSCWARTCPEDWLFKDNEWPDHGTLCSADRAKPHPHILLHVNWM